MHERKASIASIPRSSDTLCRPLWTPLLSSPAPHLRPTIITTGMMHHQRSAAGGRGWHMGAALPANWHRTQFPVLLPRRCAGTPRHQAPQSPALARLAHSHALMGVLKRGYPSRLVSSVQWAASRFGVQSGSQLCRRNRLGKRDSGAGAPSTRRGAASAASRSRAARGKSCATRYRMWRSPSAASASGGIIR